MSAEAFPISPTAFAQALEGLSIESLHAKAAELRNSITHLKASNEQMLPFADEGDQDCKEAMFENLVVIGRMNERIQLLRTEVERRGMRWADAEVEDASAQQTGVDTNMTDTNGGLVNGRAGSAQEQIAPSGRLTDDELRARLQDTMELDEEDDGVHL